LPIRGGSIEISSCFRKNRASDGSGHYLPLSPERKVRKVGFFMPMVGERRRPIEDVESKFGVSKDLVL